jgi:hypothetical protein
VLRGVTYSDIAAVVDGLANELMWANVGGPIVFPTPIIQSSAQKSKEDAAGGSDDAANVGEGPKRKRVDSRREKNKKAATATSDSETPSAVASTSAEVESLQAAVSNLDVADRATGHGAAAPSEDTAEKASKQRPRRNASKVIPSMAEIAASEAQQAAVEAARTNKQVPLAAHTPSQSAQHDSKSHTEPKDSKAPRAGGPKAANGGEGRKEPLKNAERGPRASKPMTAPATDSGAPETSGTARLPEKGTDSSARVKPDKSRDSKPERSGLHPEGSTATSDVPGSSTSQPMTEATKVSKAPRAPRPPRPPLEREESKTNKPEVKPNDGQPRAPRPPRAEGDRAPRAPRPEGDRAPRVPRPEGDRPTREPRTEGERPPRGPRSEGDHAPRSSRPEGVREPKEGAKEGHPDPRGPRPPRPARPAPVNGPPAANGDVKKPAAPRPTAGGPSKGAPHPAASGAPRPAKPASAST